MVEIQLPDAMVELEEPTEKKEQVPPTGRRQTVHFKAKQTEEEKRNEMLGYLEEMNVPVFLNRMLIDMYRERPSDPMKWCTEYLVRHEACGDQDAKNDESCLNEESRRWSAYWKIPFMIDDLLAALMEEKPAEPDRFAAAWFRWNKHAFQARYFKDGQPPPLPADWTPGSAS